jgi:competence protein ComEC
VLLLATAGWFSGIPQASYRIPGPPLWLTVCFFIALITVAAASRAIAAQRVSRAGRKQPPHPASASEWIPVTVLAALTFLVATHPFAPDLARGKLEVSVLDVGQGDSIFVAFPDSRTMLIDGGGLAGSERVGGYRSGSDVGEEVVSPYLWSRGLKQIDVVALTHAHHDHLDGLYSVLDNFRVRELWIGRDEETPAFNALLAEAEKRGVKIAHKTSGSNFDWNGVTGEFLWPRDVGPVKEASNDDSLVLRIGDGRLHFLLPGDAQQRSEDELVGSHAALAADFLKVPHHGSKTSSTQAFLAAVAPSVAVVSVGEANPFGQPAENIVQRYTRAGVRLLRTDRDGAVTALTDGQKLSVSTFTEENSR